MNRFFLLAAVSATMLSYAFGAGGDHTVTDTPLTVLGPADPSAAQAWTTNAVYTQGELVKADKQYFIAIVAGAAGSTAPYGSVDIVDGTVTWRPVLRKDRAGLFVKNNGTSEITVSFDGGSQGAKLESTEHLIWGGAGVPQSRIRLLSDASLTNSVYISEW